ncbi:MAG: Spy/CpxP family protein refolding chaperone [Polaribacter sp.]|jgi:Spy/CpxP family protein refolding chaperone
MITLLKKKLSNMRKFASLLSIFFFVLVIASCGSTETKMTSQEASNEITSRLEKKVALTTEQKTQIVTLTEASGLMSKGVRSSEEKAKYQELRKKIMDEVLTPEQKATLNAN